MPTKAHSRSIHVCIVNYPGVMLSSVLGLSDLFHISNKMCDRSTDELNTRFIVSEYVGDHCNRPESLDTNINVPNTDDQIDVLILPPSVSDDLYKKYQSPTLLNFIVAQHAKGSIICSACAGAFILAKTGLIDDRRITTHWDLENDFIKLFPHIKLDMDRVLINDGDIITAGGLMAWVDLGLEIVGQFLGPLIMTQVGKYMVVDTAPRLQQYYRIFSERHDHGNRMVINAQRAIRQKYSTVSVAELADLCGIGQRTFMRHFNKATGFTPYQYIQKYRIQKARELIETTSMYIDQVAFQVGYEDSSSFTKAFKKETGLPPKEYRKRFGVSINRQSSQL